jgi:hypothetical protein
MFIKFQYNSSQSNSPSICCQTGCPTAMGFAFVARDLDDPQAFELKQGIAKFNMSNKYTLLEF